MNFKKLIRKNIRFYKRPYRLVAAAALITVAVITGSLITGDSVRTTLVKRVAERLGDTETVIFSRNSFMAEGLLQTPLFENSAKGYLLTNGFISLDGKLIPVFVWGGADMPIPEGACLINRALAKELGKDDISAIALRLPASGLVPSGSLFVTENYTTSLRLTPEGIVEATDGGNISMKNEQIIPLNIFVNRNELAEALGVVGKINLILTAERIDEKKLNEVWDYTFSGLSVRERDGFSETVSGNSSEIVSDRVFLQQEVTETILRNNDNSNRLFSYLANSISSGGTNSIASNGTTSITSNGTTSIASDGTTSIASVGESVPYSFVTALDVFRGEPLDRGDIILSDYTAARLGAGKGDTVSVTYFVSRDLKTLSEKTVELRVKRVVPISLLSGDKTLSADFPGLSDVERCTDWDSDLPIDMSLITDEDERYWDLYRSTPKAIIAYEAVAADWSNAYGNATAIRVAGQEVDLSGLNAGMFGIQVIHPREAGLYAARNGVDFAGLFLALGCFVIISAMLLMLVPLSEMIWQRRDEISLYKALGFTRRRISNILWRESAPVVLLSSLLGVVAGLLYTAIIMWLLGNVWKGATHTDGFSVYPGAGAILGGLIAGAGLSLLLLRWVIVRNLKRRTPAYSDKTMSLCRKKIWAIIASVLSIVIIGINVFLLHSVALFVVAGIILIGTAALWGDYIVCSKRAASTALSGECMVRKSSVPTALFGDNLVGNGSATAALSGDNTDSKRIASTATFRSANIVWSTIYAGRKQAMLSFFALTTGVFIVFSVGLNRRGFADSSQLRSGTGGYALWCESSVPVYHNMATQAGREKLSLTALPPDSDVLQCLRYSADDASCLNLNKVTAPTVLGVDIDALKRSDFQIAQGLTSSDRNAVFGQMKEKEGDVYPALVDATVLTWSLGMSLGDTLRYKGDRGEEIAIRLIGTLSNSVFQGHILIDRSNFSEVWEETAGSEVFLFKVEESEKERVKTLLSQALNEYGVRISTTNDRLRQFNSVTDTYLTIFMTLGGLGLLLGIMSFIIVIRKNLVMRRREIDLFRTLGYQDHRIEQLFFRENIIVPLYAIGTGVISSIVGVSGGLMNVGVWIWLLAAIFTLFFVLCVILFVRKSVRSCLK